MNNSKKHISITNQILMLAVGAAMGLATQASAATLYFDNNGTTVGSVAPANLGTQQTWNTGSTNWNATADGTGTPAAWVDGSDAVFGAGITGTSANLATGTYNVSTAGNKIANSITVKDGTVTFLPSATPPNRTIGAGGLTLASTAAGNMTFSNANGGDTLLLSASQPWTDNQATASLVVACPVKGSAATGTVTITAAADGAGDVLISGAITDGTAGGNLGVATASTGTGRLNLQGADTYTGGTSVSSGALLLDNGGSLAHSNITITGGTFAGGTTGTGGAITDNIANDLAELISVSGSGVLDLTHLTLNLNLTGTQTHAEYVLANADVGSANVTGTQFAAANLPAGWSISYTGTAANPNDIVLIAGTATPEPASLSLAALGAVTLLVRRRKM